MATKVLTLNQISVKGLDRLPRDQYEIASEFAAPDAIMLRSHKLKMDEIADSVLAIARAGAGVNNIPVADCTARGIPVFNTPGANANAVKELVIGGLGDVDRRSASPPPASPAQSADAAHGRAVEVLLKVGLLRCSQA